MLIYSKELYDKMVKIIPKLIIGDDYRICGTFAKKGKYVTDIDVTNYVKNIDVNTVQKIVSSVDENIIFIYLTCGTDKRFTNFNNDINKMKKAIEILHSSNQISDYRKDKLLNKLNEPITVNKLIIVETFLKPFSKIRWTKDEVISGEKKLIAGDTKKLMEVMKDNESIMHFFIKWNQYYIPVDIALVDKQRENKRDIFEEINKLIINKQYYFVLRSFKYYFKNTKHFQEINYLTEDKYGLYKQILVSIYYIGVQIRYNILPPEIIAKNIKLLIDDIKKTDFNNIIIEDLGKLALEEKLSDDRYNFLERLGKLEKRFVKHLNKKLYETCIKYYKMLPDEIKKNILPLEEEFRGWH